jgi:4-oxalocrotonate tautomerase
MPFVSIQLTREGTEPGVDHVTPEQKAEIFKGVSQVLIDVLKKPPEWTWVVFQEVAMEDWGWVECRLRNIASGCRKRPADRFRTQGD